MCGIFYLFGIPTNTEYLSLSKRGPDNTQIVVYNEQHFFCFHRLSINDQSDLGNQPFYNDDFIFMCNGEIYNHKELEQKYDIECKSKSDCEVIFHLYQKGYNFMDIIKELHGVFSIILYDKQKNILYAANDSFGIRPLFYTTENNTLCLSSEMKGNTQFSWTRFPPGSIFSYDFNTKEYIFINYYHYEYPILDIINKEDCIHTIHDLLYNAVDIRIKNTDRNVGFLLSGGLDSSVVCAIGQKILGHITTFSIGLEDSVDLKHARIVSEHLGTTYHEVILTEQMIQNTLDELLYVLETYDITTIRASLPQYVLCKYIRDNTNIKVVLSGEFADEIFGSYKYFEYAPNTQEFQQETLTLLKNIHCYDVLRSDRTVSNCGLELRVPFGDRLFVDYIMSLDSTLKMKQYNGIEKYMLRQAFQGYLPESILMRKKEAFSDGVSNTLYNKKTLISILKEYTVSKGYEEKEYYKKKYFDMYKNNTIIPGYWLPNQNWIQIDDPCAYFLTNLNNE
jgi:asparagine synthase (glutamine-hydrolysing)